MIEEIIKGSKYRLPGSLSPFQKALYIHLINWKRKHITKEAGDSNYKGQLIEYDAILPENCHRAKLLYKNLSDELANHQKRYPFKKHIYFDHMASSQVANINLFLPILLSGYAEQILSRIKPDFCKLAADKLYKGFRLEYWDGNSKHDKGLLGDHSTRAGTDADIAIAYYNYADELCLWLIEHKLAEKEFTTCGGYKSKGRNKNRHLCSKSFTDIEINKHYCYYHDVRKNEYWNLTESSNMFNPKFLDTKECPFRGGMNQLWRNQLLGYALENSSSYPYQHVSFSVVKHKDNNALNNTIDSYKQLVNHNPKFSVHTSSEFVEAALKLNVTDIKQWAEWYADLYMA